MSLLSPEQIAQIQAKWGAEYQPGTPSFHDPEAAYAEWINGDAALNGQPANFESFLNWRYDPRYGAQQVRSMANYNASIGLPGWTDASGKVIDYSNPQQWASADATARQAASNLAQQQAAASGGGLGGLGTLAGIGLAAWNPLGLGLIGTGALGGGVGGLLSTGDISGGLKGAVLGAAGGALGNYLQSGSMLGGSASGMTGLNAGDVVREGGGGMLSTDMLTAAADVAKSLSAQGYDSLAIQDELLNLGLPSVTATTMANAAMTSGITAGGILNAAIPSAQASGGLLSQLGGYLNTPLGTSLASTALSGLGGYLNAQTGKEAAKTQADANIEAARIAADAAKFRPIGITGSPFGSSNIVKDAQGNVVSMGYTPTPWVQGQMDALRATSGGMLNQFQGAQAASAPVLAGGQRAMELGTGYLGTTPQEQAAKYMAEQQALLAAPRERELAALQAQQQARGTTGLAMGGTSTGMAPANPAMEAYFNAKRQQDLQLAAQATQGGMDYAKFGAGMIGTGADLSNAGYGMQTAAFAPYSTAIGGVSNLNQAAMQPMLTGADIGNRVTAGSAAAGQALATGMMNAANITGQQAMQAGSPWGNLLQGGANVLQNQNQQMFQNQLLAALAGKGATA